MSVCDLALALAGMGAVAAAVLGAPNSTTVDCFETDRDWQGTGLACHVAVSMSTGWRHVWCTQLLSHPDGALITLAAVSPQAYLLGMFMVGRIMRRPDDSCDAANEETCGELIGEGTYIDGTRAHYPRPPCRFRADRLLAFIQWSRETRDRRRIAGRRCSICRCPQGPITAPWPKTAAEETS